MTRHVFKHGLRRRLYDMFVQKDEWQRFERNIVSEPQRPHEQSKTFVRPHRNRRKKRKWRLEKLKYFWRRFGFKCVSDIHIKFDASR